MSTPVLAVYVSSTCYLLHMYQVLHCQIFKTRNKGLKLRGSPVGEWVRRGKAEKSERWSVTLSTYPPPNALTTATPDDTEITREGVTCDDVLHYLLYHQP